MAHTATLAKGPASRMHRLDQPTDAIAATQENNVVRVKGGYWDRLDIK